MAVLALGFACFSVSHAAPRGKGSPFVIWPERDNATPKRWTIFLPAAVLEDGYAGVRHILDIADAASQVRELSKSVPALTGLGLNWAVGGKLYLADPSRSFPVRLEKITVLAEGYRTGVTIEVEAIDVNLPVPPKPNQAGETPPFLLTEHPLSPVKGFGSAPSPDAPTTVHLRKLALGSRFGTRAPASTDGKRKEEGETDAVLDAKYKLQDDWVFSFVQDKQVWTVLPFDVLVRSNEPKEEATLVFRQGSRGWELAGRFPGRAVDVLPDLDADGLADFGGYLADRSYVIWSVREGAGEILNQPAAD